MLILRALLTPYRLRPSFAAILLVSGTIFISEANAQESQTPPFKFATALTTAESLPRMRSLLISRNGDLVLERYFNGAQSGSVTNIKSVSKSVLSALVGIAIERGHLSGVEQPIVDYLGDRLPTDDNILKEQITIVSLFFGRQVPSGKLRRFGALGQNL